MFVGSFIFISAGFLYWLLKPPFSNSILQKEMAFTRVPSQNSEALAGCIITQPAIP